MTKKIITCEICQNQFFYFEEHLNRDHDLLLHEYEKENGNQYKPKLKITNKTQFNIYLKELAKDIFPNKITATNANKYIYNLAFKYYGSWKEALKELGLNAFPAFEDKLIAEFKQAYLNKVDDPVEWKRVYRKTINRYENVKTVYQKAGIISK